LEDWAYNLTRSVKTLRIEVNDGQRRWQPRSPAMAAGPLTIEAGLVAVADGCDLTKARGRMAFNLGNVNILPSLRFLSRKCSSPGAMNIL